MYELVQDDLRFIWDLFGIILWFQVFKQSIDFQAVLLAPHLWSPEPCEAESKGTSPWSPSFQPRFSILSILSIGRARQLFFASLVAMGVAGAVRAPVPKWQPVDGAEVLLETCWNMLKQVQTADILSLKIAEVLGVVSCLWALHCLEGSLTIWMNTCTRVTTWP